LFPQKQLRIDYILSLPVVENGKTIVVKNVDNGNVMKYSVEKGKLSLKRLLKYNSYIEIHIII